MTASEWAVALEVCTESQLRALDLWRRGWGYKRIGVLLDLDPSTAAYRVRAGLRNVGRALEERERLTASGS